MSDGISDNKKISIAAIIITSFIISSIVSFAVVFLMPSALKNNSGNQVINLKSNVRDDYTAKSLS